MYELEETICIICIYINTFSLYIYNYIYMCVSVCAEKVHLGYKDITHFLLK